MCRRSAAYMLLVALLCVSVSASAESGEQPADVGGYVLASDKTADSIAGHLNFALVRLGSATFSGKDGQRAWRELELRFDAGNLRKRDLSRAKKHLDQMFRRMAQGDFQEASEQIFRARRFIMKTFPFSMDTELLSEILYYQSILNDKLGQAKKARTDYCTYLYLMSNLSRSTASIGQKVQELKSCDPIDETGELVLSSKRKGGVVYVDGAPVGVVSPDIPYTAPYMPIGLHFVEVRRPGMARWGEVVDIKPGKTLKKKVRLKRARSGVNELELDPLNDLVFHGKDASDEGYIQDRLFSYVERVGLNTFVLGKVRTLSKGKSELKLVAFKDNGVRFTTVEIPADTFEYEALMIEALRNVGIESALSSGLAPERLSEFLYFKVK